MGTISPARADGVVRSGFLFQLDNSIFNSADFEFASRLQGEEKFSLPDAVVPDELPVQVKGIEASVKYKMKAGSNHVFLGAEHVIASENLEAHVSIREISIDGVIEKIVSGVKVRVRVQGLCSNVQIDLPQGKASVTGTLKTGVDSSGLPGIEVPWFDVTWTPESWVVTSLECTGVTGFKERVQSNLKDYLKDPSAFTAEMKKAVNDEVQAQAASLKTWFQEPRLLAIDVAGLKVTMRPKAIVGLKAEQFQVRGELEFAFTSSTYNDLVEVAAGTDRPESKGFVLYLPDGALTALKSMAYRTGFLAKRKSSKELSAWQELRSSLINEVVVWPELQLYGKSSEFLFDFTAGREPQLGSLTADSLGAPIGAIDAQVDVLSWSPKMEGGLQKFVSFKFPFTGQYRLSIENGELAAVMSNMKSTLTHTWDADYAKKLTFSDLDTDRLRTEIVKSLTGTGMRFTLGKLKITNDVSLSAQSVRKEGGWLRFDWK